MSTSESFERGKLILRCVQVTSEFKVIAATKEEYLKVIEELKAREPKTTKRFTKPELHLIQLRQTLESRLEAIDQELAVSAISSQRG